MNTDAAMRAHVQGMTEYYHIAHNAARLVGLVGREAEYVDALLGDFVL